MLYCVSDHIYENLEDINAGKYIKIQIWSNLSADFSFIFWCCRRCCLIWFPSVGNIDGQRKTAWTVCCCIHHSMQTSSFIIFTSTQLLIITIFHFGSKLRHQYFIERLIVLVSITLIAFHRPINRSLYIFRIT